MHPFVRTEEFPSWFVNAVQSYLGSSSFNFVIQRNGSTGVVLFAGPHENAVAVNIQGRWRYVEGNLVAVHPGGAAGLYNVWVTARDNEIDNSPDPFTDHTNYAFELVVLPVATTPTVTISRAVWRLVGRLLWDGAAITSLYSRATPLPYNLDLLQGLVPAADRLPYFTSPTSVALATISPFARTLIDDPDAATMRGTLGVATSGDVTTLLEAMVPIGVPIPYGGSSLPAGGRWDWADGGLINKTTYSEFFGALGHVYNGGVDPGSNMVRKPDKRGRVSVGADNFGQGAAGRLPNSNRVLGQSGGAERHQHTVASHAHYVPAVIVANAGGGNFVGLATTLDQGPYGQMGYDGLRSRGTRTSNYSLTGKWADGASAAANDGDIAGTDNIRGDVAELYDLKSEMVAPGTDLVSIMQLYEVDNWIVRVK